ncbi:unnamed protein product [Urochloa decumbens]|uniref:F-box associated beta-propeller type 3 domain-containing protein n=1 Tax=Urochloa decumbens TaxID=240449 RepID=A0ABC8Y667_9POAL
MGKRKARDDEVAAATAAAEPRKFFAMKRTKRRTRGASTNSSTPSGMCDDVLRNIFARVPARTAVASMALSKHHRSLMLCPDFRALHRRLAPPLPYPHIAYVATAKVRRGGGVRDRPVSGYLGFHIAGGGSGKSNGAPMRSLAGPLYLEKNYVNTCNGIVLLAGKPRPSTCVLWNPAVADEEKEVTVPVHDHDDPVILGLGYGPRTQTYKLLLTRRRLRHAVLKSNPPITRYPKELLVYTLGGGGGAETKKKQPRLRAVSSSGEGAAGEFRGQALYMDGTIYLLDVTKPAMILAFDVDSETVAYIDLPQPRQLALKLMELSGRPCLDMYDGAGVGSRALWLLTVGRQWERRCLITRDRNDHKDLYRYSIAGVWDCGGVLFVYMHLPHPVAGEDDDDDGDDEDKIIFGDQLYMYRVASKKMSRAKLLYNLSPVASEYHMCWGYKPTLVSPGSIVGELSQDEESQRLCTAEIMESLKPLSESDTRKGKKATLDTVCFMDFLVRVMRKLPNNMEDVLKMPLLNSRGAYSSSRQYEICDSDSDS